MHTRTRARMHMQAHKRGHAHTDIHSLARAQTHAHIRTSTHTHACMHMHEHIHTVARAHTCMHTFAHLHIKHNTHTLARVHAPKRIVPSPPTWAAEERVQRCPFWCWLSLLSHSFTTTCSEGAVSLLEGREQRYIKLKSRQQNLHYGCTCNQIG